MDEATLKIRRTGITGTDAVAICLPAESYRKPIEVWRSKVEGWEPRIDSERARWGNILEPLVAQDFAMNRGCYYCEVPVLRHRERTWQLGSPDGFLLEQERITSGSVEVSGAQVRIYPRGGIEELASAIPADDSWPYLVPRPDHGYDVKTHGSWAFSRAGGDRGYGADGTDAVPDYIRVQCDWYMALTDQDHWWVAVLADTHERHNYLLRRDQRLEDLMLEACYDWRQRHLVRGERPDPDGSPAFEAYVQERYREHSAELVPASREQLEIAAELRAVKAQQKKTEQRRRELEQALKVAIGPAAGLMAPSGKPLVTWRRDRAGRVAHAKLVDRLFDEIGASDEERERMADETRGEPTRRFLLK